MQTLTDEYNDGYRVLFDKDGLTKQLPKPLSKSFREGRPLEEEFLGVVKEFWFEVSNAAKYLVREDLWSVKFRANIIHELLLKMIRWHEQALHDWQYSTHYIGKGMKTWVVKDIWDELYGCFAHFDPKDSWEGLFNTVALFRRLAKKTAKKLGVKYPLDVDKAIFRFISQKRGRKMGLKFLLRPSICI